MRYHISASGEPAQCNAEPGNCPLGGVHLVSLRDAERVAEAMNEHPYHTTDDGRVFFDVTERAGFILSDDGEKHYFFGKPYTGLGRATTDAREAVEAYVHLGLEVGAQAEDEYDMDAIVNEMTDYQEGYHFVKEDAYPGETNDILQRHEYGDYEKSQRIYARLSDKEYDPEKPDAAPIIEKMKELGEEYNRLWHESEDAHKEADEKYKPATDALAKHVDGKGNWGAGLEENLNNDNGEPQAPKSNEGHMVYFILNGRVHDDLVAQGKNEIDLFSGLPEADEARRARTEVTEFISSANQFFRRHDVANQAERRLNKMKEDTKEAIAAMKNLEGKNLEADLRRGGVFLD